MCLDARTLPHLMHGYFSPQCTPTCFISLWCLGSSLSHTGHTVASLSTVGSWYGTSATLWASAPSGRSSLLRRVDTCCFILLRARLLTTTSPPTGVGVAPHGGPSLAAWPLHAIPGCQSISSASSSEERPMFDPSSVSDGWASFHHDAISSETSRTSLTLSASVTTEMKK